MPHNKIKNAFIEQIKLAFILISLCIALIFTDWLWTWDQTLYDIQVRASTSPAPNDVVIIAIDETSLNDFGRWPWQRSTHAALIDRLNEMGAKIIVMDVIFSEETKNNKAADRALADAIHRAKNVILPVLAEQTRLGSQLKETLPLPMLIEAGAKLGHVHIELDADGIARSVFLYEGLGKPRWPHISLAALQQDNSQQIISRATHGKNRSPFSWHRTQQKLIHFLGPPGQFKRISYRDVIRGAVKKESINGKTVFVGVTATGLGDALPTPVSGLTQPMSGVEINANIFASLRDNSNYQVMKNPWRLIISIIIIMLPIIFLPRTSPRGALILCTSLIFFSLSLSLTLIYYWHTWFAPLAVILPLALCYPLWSWRRLEYTTQYLESQIK
ncbi:MAG TPA: CHASE2 domain-containing protein, partial [Gammaproteobacteria bacterium]|nr:CHASE2 domain-containing protein [Gammaproteobacteria bacterium]